MYFLVGLLQTPFLNRSPEGKRDLRSKVVTARKISPEKKPRRGKKSKKGGKKKGRDPK